MPPGLFVAVFVCTQFQVEALSSARPSSHHRASITTNGACCLAHSTLVQCPARLLAECCRSPVVFVSVLAVSMLGLIHVCCNACIHYDMQTTRACCMFTIVHLSTHVTLLSADKEENLRFVDSTVVCRSQVFVLCRGSDQTMVFSQIMSFSWSPLFLNIASFSFAAVVTPPSMARMLPSSRSTCAPSSMYEPGREPEVLVNVALLSA